MPESFEDSALAAPRWLIEPKAGVVWLRLVPYIEGSGSRERNDPGRIAELPFAVDPNRRSFDLYLHHGQREDLLRLDAHGSWSAYALTPFGWALFAHPRIRRGRLIGLSLQPHLTGTPLETFARVAEWIKEELGPATIRFGRPPYLYRQEFTLQERAVPGRLEWRRGWGRVILTFDPGDFMPRLELRWGTDLTIFGALGMLVHHTAKMLGHRKLHS